MFKPIFLENVEQNFPKLKNGNRKKFEVGWVGG
jgi:hypothetical protein